MINLHIWWCLRRCYLCRLLFQMNCWKSPHHVYSSRASEWMHEHSPFQIHQSHFLICSSFEMLFTSKLTQLWNIIKMKCCAYWDFIMMLENKVSLFFFFLPLFQTIGIVINHLMSHKWDSAEAHPDQPSAFTSQKQLAVLCGLPSDWGGPGGRQDGG